MLKDIILDSDLSDLRYLYRFGDYIYPNRAVSGTQFYEFTSENGAAYGGRTYTGKVPEKGFEVMGRDLSKKSAVQIRYELGFERMVVKAAIQNFVRWGWIRSFAALQCGL